MRHRPGWAGTPEDGDWVSVRRRCSGGGKPRGGELPAVEELQLRGEGNSEIFNTRCAEREPLLSTRLN